MARAPFPLTFFLSTGRCGTQWICNTLQTCYAGQLETTHEPVRGPYHAKHYLRREDLLAAAGADPDLARHRDYIARCGEDRPYVETGWPCFAVLPHWIREFPERVRIVHLVRHPVPNALSLATQEMYRRPDWMAAMALTPDDPGVAGAALAADWRTLSEYQRCLFFWSEVHQWGLELRGREPRLPWLQIRFEDLFGPGDETLRELLSFLALPVSGEALAARRQSYDVYRAKAAPADWQDLGPLEARVGGLARGFGYDLQDVSGEAIEQRYFATFPERTRQAVRSLSRRLNWRRRWRRRAG